jgi:hypothetical protein
LTDKYLARNPDIKLKILENVYESRMMSGVEVWVCMMERN